MAEDTDPDQAELSATAARAGRPGVPVLWVLVVSTLVALVVVVAAWAFFSRGLAGGGGSQQITTPVQAKKFDTPTASASTQPASAKP